MSLNKRVLEVLSIAFTSNELSQRQKWILGLINLSLVVIFWVLSSFLVNDLFETDIYRKPFFITYINTGCFAFYLIPYLIHENLLVTKFLRKVRESYHLHQAGRSELDLYIRLANTGDDAVDSGSGGYGSTDNLAALELQDVSTNTALPSITDKLQRAAVNAGSTVFDIDSGSSSPRSGSANSQTPTPHQQIQQQLLSQLESQLQAQVSDDEEVEIPLYETIKLSLQFSILWFSANLVTNASLSYTSVASQTILSSSSSFFTLLIGYICAVERINTNKVAGLVLSFIGVIIVTKIDSNDPPSSAISPLATLFGNLLALSGAFFYGVYTILLKFKVMIKNSKKERTLNTHLFFSFVGIFSLILLWPLIIGLHVTGLEKFELPPTTYALTLLLINALITFVSDLVGVRQFCLPHL